MALETKSTAAVSPITTIVAEIAIELNIVLKNHRLYGEDHPVTKGSIQKIVGKLTEGFRSQSPISLHFTRRTIIFGDSFLTKSNPIYQKLAEAMWSVGIIGMVFEKGVSGKDLSNVIHIINEVREQHVRLDDVKERYKDSFPATIPLELFSRDLLVLSEKDSISPVSGKEETKLWEDFIFSMEAQGGNLNTSAPVSKSVMELAKKISTKVDIKETNYDTAMVNYLKSLDKSHREKGILTQTDLGKKINDFISNINPELRQQMLCATLTAPDLSETVLKEITQVVDYEYMVDSLKHLNSEGRGLPITTYRTLSLVGMLGEEVEEGIDGDDEEIDLAETETENFQALLDTLLTEDDRFAYMSQEYEAKIESLQEYAEELASSTELDSSEVLYEKGDIERHFVGVNSELLDYFPEDVEYASSAGRHADKAFTVFLERSLLSDCLQCILVGKRAAEIDAKRELFPYKWESLEVKDQLISYLSDASVDQRSYARMILSTIGNKVVPQLLEILVASDSMVLRRQVVNIFVEMDGSPCSSLVEILENEPPWFVQRNIVYILRRRKDKSSEEFLREYFANAHPKVAVEIIRYLFAVRSREWLGYLERAIFSKSRELSLGAARMVVQVRWDEVVQLVIDRLEQFSTWSVGSRFHLELLQLLLQSRNKKALTYVTALVINKKGLFSWQTSRFQEQVRLLMREAAR